MRTLTEQNIIKIKRLSEVDSPDFSRMTIDDMIAWEPPEPDPFALLSYPLQTEEWRKAFLHDYYWVGETALFIAVAHVWATLAPPRAERGTQMGILSGTGGTGKTGVVRTLKQFLKEMLDVNHSFPDSGDYSSMTSWNVDAMATFAADDAGRAKILERYEAVLDGRDLSEPTETSTDVNGPWQPPRPTHTRPHRGYR